MALKQSTTFKGLTAADSYLKITQVVIFEKLNNNGAPLFDGDGNKLYSANITYTRYNSDAKTNELETMVFQITNLIESDLKYNKFYNKTKINFANSVDVI